MLSCCRIDASNKVKKWQISRSPGCDCSTPDRDCSTEECDSEDRDESGSPKGSVTVVFGLVGTLFRHTDIFGLLFGQFVELYTDLLQVQARSEERRVGKECRARGGTEQ